MIKIFELIDQLDLPDGLVSLVHGGKHSVDALLEHTLVKAVSFVGSTPVAKYIYSKGTQNGRSSSPRGAKNPVVLMPDCDVEMTSKIVADSVYGCAGQRCLAASVIITVDDNKRKLKDSL